MKSVVPGISKVKTLGGITEYCLEKNGLRILLAPEHSAPVVGCMVTYHVGSRNEATGYTGSTHLLEHLLFKRTKKFRPENNTAMDVLLEKKGAMINATTWYDRTNYYEVLPSSELSLAIEIEADRMRTAEIREEDMKREMPVVWNEFERVENNPMNVLDREVWAAAFTAHPYHHSTIGWRDDIENVSAERLRAFYDQFYWPDNATIVIVGDFKEEQALSLIKRHFGSYTKAPKAIPSMYTREPKQEGERRLQVRRTGQDGISIAYKIPQATHEDIPALIVLAMILSDDKTSRFHKALIDTNIATDADAVCMRLLDPGLFQIYAVLHPGVQHAKAEATIHAVLEEVRLKGVTAKELQSAKQAIRLYNAAQRDGAYAFLSSINEDIAAGDWTRFVTLPEMIMKVTAADVKRVAKTYLKEDTSTVGWVINTARV